MSSVISRAFLVYIHTMNFPSFWCGHLMFTRGCDHCLKWSKIAGKVWKEWRN